MANIAIRAELFKKSIRNVKITTDAWFYPKFYRFKGEKLLKRLKEDIETCSRQKAEKATLIQQQRIEQEKAEYLRVIEILYPILQAEEIVKVFKMWRMVVANMDDFQTHLCWVYDSKRWYLKNSCDPGYITWMKEGKNAPILRRWFDRDFKYMLRITATEEEIKALLTICKEFHIGQTMSQEKMDSIIVMDLLTEKVYP
ncbi:MAG TPA: hypothetical protein PKA28_17640 [Methylomusa anaerophila]|uniref:Cbl-PTB domain-containing protein n=1 Tax=Methylomusa anaerophila TaxID=1930071 RepID=A0A348AMH6_9FIRM|nr:hypothetical protein [Methylomusa anaerophila]BBB92274.1 hypothetical protein MAMMFC1_02959 [Methylomusa anaerophila]HML90267.1 hypothetical protein [Methylomusa anaerophila]